MPNILTLDSATQFEEAIAADIAIHGDPEPIWREFHHHHPRWSAPGVHRAVIEDGRIVALTSVARWEHRIGKTTLPAAEIGLVGTLPEYRNRGYSRALMDNWLGTLHDERIPLAFLIGIPNFYERWQFHYAAPDHANHFMDVSWKVLEACAAPRGNVRAADVERDVPAIRQLIDQDQRSTPLSPTMDSAMIRYFAERRDVHGVEWQVIEDDAHRIQAVARFKKWSGGTGPQANGAATLIAATPGFEPHAARLLLDHLDGGSTDTLPLAIAPHGRFATWLHLRGANRRCDRSTYPGGYAAMVRVNDLVTVLKALRTTWDDSDLCTRFAGQSITLRTGPERAQVATVDIRRSGIDIHPDAGNTEIDAPPAVTIPWITGWRSAADWLDATPFPPMPGPAVDMENPGRLPEATRSLLRALFPVRHPYIGDTIQGA